MRTPKFLSGPKPGGAGLIVVTALISLLLVACDQEPDVDAVPPGRITDLRLTGSTTTSLTLVWTATGDDGLEGTAASYDLRYLPGELTDETWVGAARFEGEPAPSQAGATDSLVIAGLSAGTAYSVGLRVVDESCNWSDLSNVVTATTVSQEVWLKVPCVNDGIGLDVDWGNSDSELSATWGVAAGAEEYQYAIGTEPGAADVAAWTSTGRDTRATRTGLALSHAGTYYFTVRALAGAACGESACSDGVTVDLTPPSSAVAALPVETTALTFRVSWNGLDDLSGLDGYWVRFREGLTGSWRDLLAQTADTATYFTGIADQTYYFDCRARDLAGNFENYPSQPDASTTIRILTIPKVPWVNDGLGSDEDWTSSPDHLSAHWGSVADVQGYEYAVGTSRAGVDVVPWTFAGADTFMSRSGLQLANGAIYYVAVRAAVGPVRGVATTSDGIRVDLSPPMSVVDHLPPETYGLALDVSWAGFDGLSGVACYDVQVKPEGLHGTWEDWLAGTTQTSARFDAEDGHIYCFRCRATDKVGNREGYPDAYDARTTFYLWVRPVAWVSDGHFADEQWTGSLTTLSANWEGVPYIEYYEYAVGSSPGLGDISDWTSTGTATRMTRSDLALAQGATYYTSVRAGAKGLRGDWVASNGITVDAVAPESQVNPLPDSISTRAFWVTWTGADDLSGIASYDVQRRDGVGGTWVNWINGTGNTGSTMRGTDGHTYYFRSRARDKAGNAEAYPEEADAFTYFKGSPAARRPKFALHLAAHGVANCGSRKPAITRVEDLVRYWPDFTDLDAFMVIFDYDSLNTYQYGLNWPREWGSCSTRICDSKSCIGYIIDPGDLGIACVTSGCRASAAHPFLVVAYHWFAPNRPGEIEIRPNYRTGSLGIVDCLPGGEQVYADWIYNAGVQVDPYEGPATCCPGGSHWQNVKSLFE